ncbi:MAG: HYR domain-containing protein [Saprospiraceae bacterium]
MVVKTIQTTVNPFDCNLTATLTSQNASCFGLANGSALVNSVGTGSNFVYEWSNGATTAQVDELRAGTYQVSVTDEFNCTVVETIIIEEPAPLEISSNSVKNVTCYGFNDGALSIEISGGTSGYNYEWSNGVMNSNLNNLSAGTYSVLVQDANQCEKSATFEITQPDELTAEVVNQVNLVCEDDTNGSAEILVTGGTAGYNFLWSNGQTGQMATDLGIGVHTIEITDNNGCIATQTIEITAKDEIAPVLELHTAEISLDENGMAALDISMVDKGSYDNCSQVQLTLDQSNFTCDDLGTQTITVTGTDDSNNTNTATVNIQIIDKIAPTLTCPENITRSDCPDIIVFDFPEAEDNCSVESVEIIQGPQPGSSFPKGTTIITFEAKDQSGNSATCSMEITLENTLESQTSQMDITCNGYSNGEARVMISGGNPGYTYLWNDPNAQTSNTATNLGPGNYTVEVTDAEGCKLQETFEIMEPEALMADASSVIQPNSGQADGSVLMNISGGSGNLTYKWIKTGDPSFNSNDKDLINISEGIYKLTITDENGCSLQFEIRVDATVSVKNAYLSKEISIFPNPSSGLINISTGNLSGYSKCYVIDTKGSTVFEGTFELLSRQDLNLDLSYLSNGLYVLRIIVEEGVAVQTLQISKVD